MFMFVFGITFPFIPLYSVDRKKKTRSKKKKFKSKTLNKSIIISQNKTKQNIIFFRV